MHTGRSDKWPTSLVARIEGLQERAYALTDTPLEAVLDHVRTCNTSPLPNVPLNANAVFSAMPEVAFDASEDWYEALCNCAVSKYDRAPFIQRFWNIIPLCHGEFASMNGGRQIPIAVSSLPFYDIGGHACRFDDGTHTVFLNEGLLGSLPYLYGNLMPILNPKLFGQGRPGKNVASVLEAFFHLCRNKTSLLSHPDRGSKLRYPSAYESWYFQQLLMGNIVDKTNKNFPEPRLIPLNQKQAMFLSCRGAFVFVLAHEFAHVYARHHDVLSSPEPPSLRDASQVDEIYNANAATFAAYGVSRSHLTNQAFSVEQPLEEQADALALGCVQSYIARNELDDEKAECVMMGVVGLFFLMELTERLLAYDRFQRAGLDQILKLPLPVRNVLVQGAHPAPLSRLSLASGSIFHGDDPHYAQLRESFDRIAQYYERIWNAIDPVLADVARDVDIRGNFGVDRAGMFGTARPTHFKPSILQRGDDIEALLKIGRGLG